MVWEEIDLGKGDRNDKVELPLKFTFGELKTLREAIATQLRREREMQEKYTGSLYYNLSVLTCRECEALATKIQAVLGPLDRADTAGMFLTLRHVGGKGEHLGDPRWFFCELACLADHMHENPAESLEPVVLPLAGPGLTCTQCGKSLVAPPVDE